MQFPLNKEIWTTALQRDTDNSVCDGQREGGVGDGWRWGKRGGMGTSVIVSTLKTKLKENRFRVYTFMRKILKTDRLVTRLDMRRGR